MKPNNYLNDLQDWQNKQYQPGEFLGGKFSPAFKYGSKKLGILLLITGIFIIFLAALLISVDEDKLTSILGFVFGALLIAGGVRKIKK